MKLVAAIVFISLHTVTCSMSPDMFVGSKKLQIGYGDNCHLFWKGEEGDDKNAEFRCDTSKGDSFWIEKRGELYAIGFDDCPLFWLGEEGDVKNAEFRCGKPISDLFYIKPRPSGMWAIGFDDCPLFWLGEPGDIKNAEFRCGESISDVFWIKGADCKLTKVQIIDTEQDATFDGEELIGVTTAASCSGGEHTLILEQSRDLTEELTLGTTKSTERNWEVSASVTVEASAKFWELADPCLRQLVLPSVVQLRERALEKK